MPRGQAVAFGKDVLSGVKAEDDKAKQVLESMLDILDHRTQREQDWIRLCNRRGDGLLVASVLILTGMVALQVETSFREHANDGKRGRRTLDLGNGGTVLDSRARTASSRRP